MRHLIRKPALLFLVLSTLNLPFTAIAAEPDDTSLYRALDVAREMMNSNDIYDRILAAGALSDIGDTQALVLLERCIAIDDIVIRRSAIDTLITASHPNSINLLFKAASENTEVLGLMAESLASVPRDDMGDLLVEALDGSTDFVKKHALQALVRGNHNHENTVGINQVGKCRHPVLGTHGDKVRCGTLQFACVLDDNDAIRGLRDLG